METVLLIIYAAASYWATNKVLYEGKLYFTLPLMCIT